MRAVCSANARPSAAALQAIFAPPPNIESPGPMDVGGGNSYDPIFERVKNAAKYAIWGRRLAPCCADRRTPLSPPRPIRRSGDVEAGKTVDVGPLLKDVTDPTFESVSKASFLETGRRAARRATGQLRGSDD